MGHYEGAGFGMTWGSIFEDEFSMAWILILLLADTFFYAVVAWYASLINPMLIYALVLTMIKFSTLSLRKQKKIVAWIALSPPFLVNLIKHLCG